jgi:hypothetical protein
VRTAAVVPAAAKDHAIKHGAVGVLPDDLTGDFW